MGESGYQRYEKFFHGPCHEVVEWQDTETSAQGWLAINSLTGGAAGGGTRMKRGAAREDAIFLAKTMEIKFRISGPSIGGGKSVLSFVPANEEEKRAVLARWFQHIGAYLKSCYGTGGDQGVSEDEVIHLTAESIGLAHPQEGVLQGHFAPDAATRARLLRQLGEGVELPVRLDGYDRDVTIADVITGYGVAAAVKVLYEQTGGSVVGKRVLVEGFGAVGGPAAYYLEEMGARVVGVVCQIPGSTPGAAPTFRWRVSPEGLDARGLMAARPGPHCTDLPAGGSEGPDPAPFWETAADIFIPAATSYTIDPQRIEQLRAAGVRVIACGANTPFADRKLGEYAVQQQADEAFLIIPDFIANCGMARTFAYLMHDGVEVSEAAIKADVETAIRDAMVPLLAGFTADRGLLERAFSLYIPETVS